MSAAEDLGSGKGHKNENFPVGSFLIAPRHRPTILAFYRFARTADDVADHPSASEAEKLDLLETMRASLAGESDADAPAVRLREALAARGLATRHGLDLLEAFRRDVVKRRYADWDELMDYCRYSAAPVGRMVLDIHGESPATWPANDALCAALQVINHLQDCAKDYAGLDRVYLPLDALEAAGANVEALGRERASPALLSAIAGLAERAQALLESSRPFAGQIRDARLRLEVAFIQAIAEDLTRRLRRRDPLCERVHHRKSELAVLAGVAAGRFAVMGPGRPPAAMAAVEDAR
jgi:squalene synthase HpnC